MTCAAPGETIVGGAPVSAQVLAIALARAPSLAAADGGADAVLAAGLRPARVVGDMDSLSDAARTALGPVMRPIAEQDSTDFAKALRTSVAPFTIAVGFVGARSDHFLACLSELGRRGPDAPPSILLSDDDCLCVLPGAARLDLPAGTRLSLWPLGPARAESTGLKWPLSGIDFAPNGRVGTSNLSIGRVVTIRVTGGPMLLILPAASLDAMLEMLEIGPRGAAAPSL